MPNKEARGKKRAREISNEYQRVIRSILEKTPTLSAQNIGQQEEYSTDSAHAEALNRAKLTQRLELASLARKDGTTLELFAGRGNLTNAVYKQMSKRNILVEFNKETVETYTSPNTDSTRTDIFIADNMEFISDVLPTLDLLDLTIVDFDAFGSTAKIIRHFFANYPVHDPLYIAVTDGVGSNLVRIARDPKQLRQRLIDLGYPLVERRSLNIMQYCIKLIDTLVERVAQTHRLKYEKINASYNRRSTVYCGYKLSK